MKNYIHSHLDTTCLDIALEKKGSIIKQMYSERKSERNMIY